jgi:hypothetical protein
MGTRLRKWLVRRPRRGWACKRIEKDISNISSED